MDVYEQIEAWIQGSMTDAEKMQFEQQLQQDPELLAKADLYRQLHMHLGKSDATGKGEISLRNTLKSVIDENRQEPRTIPVKSGKLRWIIIAAAAAVTLFVTLTFLNSGNDSQKLYSKYNQYRDDLSLITRGGDVDSLLDLAVRYFNKKQYDSASAAFETAKPGQKKYQLAQGYAFLQTGHFTEADSTFRIIASGVSVYQSDANWYLALSQLKQEKKTTAIQYLKQIPADADVYKDAHELLGKLE